MADKLVDVWDYLTGLPLHAKVVTGGIITGVAAVIVLRKTRSKPRGCLLHRWIYDKQATALSYLPIPKYVFFLSRRYIRRISHGHGMGRHTQEEVYQLLDEDLQALSDFLGDKKFIVGDNPCQEDCAIFGLLAELYWESFGDRTEQIFQK
ncbi:hypothetical protein FSP39_006055 [Pinctada imbricata]|uniref:Metaxin glutathione S-transferase domain-containing protein n=1 Tax=Pinctada imbricata TaxID=66713 RepID=A0AA88XRX1_PINIB|nr:hypothetical protein FSP39_006055 [Pinctada imbricata]